MTGGLLWARALAAREGPRSGERIELTVQRCEHGLEFLLDAALSADHSCNVRMCTREAVTGDRRGQCGVVWSARDNLRMFAM